MKASYTVALYRCRATVWTLGYPSYYTVHQHLYEGFLYSGLTLYPTFYYYLTQMCANATI